MHEWAMLDESTRKLKRESFTDQIVKTILPSGAKKYEEALEQEKRLNRNLKLRERVAWGATVLSLVFGLFIFYVSQLNGATGKDANAASSFAKYRELDAELSTLREDRAAINREKNLKTETSVRLENLKFELGQLNEDIGKLEKDQRGYFDEGLNFISEADEYWNRINPFTGRYVKRKNKPNIPYLFSIELMNARSGESLLLHYGYPHDPKFVLMNTGPSGVYKNVISPRFVEISETILNGQPVPLELVIIGDQDADKSSGLRSMLKEITEDETDEDVNTQYTQFKNIWFNLFGTQNGEGRELRIQIKNLINEADMTLNAPFDHYVLSPEAGRASVEIEGGLVITILGPVLNELEDLHQQMKQKYSRGSNAGGNEIEVLHDETFTEINIDTAQKQISFDKKTSTLDHECKVSLNAAQKSISNEDLPRVDRSITNRASLVLLFEFKGVSFLFTGDSDEEQIMKGIDRANISGLSDLGVDLMSIPHLGSEHNVSQDFFERISANHYLFSGDGRHDNPSEEAISSLITARPCDYFTMYFGNRGAKGSDHGERLDAFFAEETQYKPNYRRGFRASEKGSVRIDLGEVLNY
ncbi:MAG: hypothetical protein ABJN69_01010 [Hellea sp.]